MFISDTSTLYLEEDITFSYGTYTNVSPLEFTYLIYLLHLVSIKLIVLPTQINLIPGFTDFEILTATCCINSLPQIFVFHVYKLNFRLTETNELIQFNQTGCAV